MQTYPECSNHDGDERSGAHTTDVVKQLMDRPLTHPLQMLHQLYGHQPPKHTQSIQSHGHQPPKHTQSIQSHGHQPPNTHSLYNIMATSLLNTPSVYNLMSTSPLKHTVYTISWPPAP